MIFSENWPPLFGIMLLSSVSSVISGFGLVDVRLRGHVAVVEPAAGAFQQREGAVRSVTINVPAVERLLDLQRAVRIALGNAGHLDGVVALGDGQACGQSRAIACRRGSDGELGAVVELQRHAVLEVEVVLAMEMRIARDLRRLTGAVVG